MKFFYLILSFLILVSCVQKPETEEQPKLTKEKTNYHQGTIEETPEATKKVNKSFDYYAGTIGLYGEDVLLEVTQNDLQLTGRYWYLKHGKQILIEGTASAKSAEWQLSEMVKNVVTGYMTLEQKDNKLVGQWYAPGKKSELQEVELKKVHTSKSGRINPEFEEYTRTKTITMYNGDIDVEEEATDDIRLVRVGHYVLFQYFVIGTNAHVGHINGLAKLEGKNKAIFKGEEDCQLSLNFDKNEVTIVEDEDCSYYRGMRAYFDGTLKK